MQTAEQAEIDTSKHFIFARLDGNVWGVRGPAGIAPGTRITVQKRDGSDTVVKCGKVVTATATYTIQREPRQAPSENVPLKVF